MGTLNVKLQYPFSNEVEYETYLDRINLDAERIRDISTGKGFIVKSAKGIKDDLKDPNGIFSTKFGQTLQDMNPFANRYRCKCGHLSGRVYHGITCDLCGSKVEYVDDDFEYFGWICLKDPYKIIHPNLFKSIAFLIGADRFNNILFYEQKKDQDGNDIIEEPPKDEPFRGIGMIHFHERFNEVMDYYVMKNPNKRSYYDDIMSNSHNVFAQSIPVYTTLLRPYRVENGTFHFEDNNATYTMMAKLAAVINTDELKIFRKDRPKNQLLYDLQMKFNVLYDEVINTLSTKKGQIRSLFGGRYNYCARSVIVAGPKLGIDQVKLSYHCLVGLLQQVIINILHKSFNMTYDEAYKTLWFESMAEPNPRIVKIVEGLIRDSEKGLPVIINRNPTRKVGYISVMVY